MATIQDQNSLFQGPFTKILSHKQKLHKIRNVKGDSKEVFLQQLKEETDLQKKLAFGYPQFVMPILDFQIAEGPFLGGQRATIKYDCDAKCLPLFDVVKELYGLNIEQRKRELCLKLFEIAKWIFDKKITHRNLKPSNILYYEGKVLLTDFGSQRTFYQNYIADFTKKEEKEWQEQYYFYVTKKYLQIFTDNVDIDFRKNEHKDWSEYQKIDQLIESDLWAIGLIILEIFCSKDEISKEIGCDITSNKKQYYGLNRKNLNKALDIFKTKTDEKLYETLKNLLNFNYPEVWKIFNDDQVRPLDIGGIQIEQRNSLPSQPPQPPKIDIFTSIRNFNQLNFSIINFSQAFRQEQEEIQQLGPTLQEVKQKTDETIKTTKLFIFDIINEVTKNLEICSGKFKFISHQSLIHMNKQELVQYQEKIIQSNKKQNKKDNNLEVVDFRLKALALLDSNQFEKDFQEDLIFYLNDQEYEKLLQNTLYYLNLSQEKQQYKSYLSEKSYKLICEGYYDFNFGDYQYLNIKILQYNKDNNFIQNIIQNKTRLFKLNGIEDLKFNESLKSVNKCERFINKGELKDLIQDYKEFEKIGHLQLAYKQKLLQQINNQQFAQDIREQYEKAFFQIYQKLDWELDQQSNKRKYKDFHDFMDKHQIRQKIHPLISYIYNQKIYSIEDKFSRNDETYLRSLEIKSNLSLRQNIQNKIQNSQYYGQVIDNLPYGVGFTILGKDFIQFGIYQNKKLIQGWSIKFLSNIISQDQIYFDQGQFQNGFLKGQGTAEEIFITQKSQQTDYRTYKQKKGQFLNNKLDGEEGTYKIEQFDNIIYEERQGSFIEDNLHGQGRIYYDQKYENYREGKFENGKQIDIHYEYKMVKGKQTKNPINPPSPSCMLM